MEKIYLYNTLAHKKEEFIPIKEGKLGMYCCGPTVYNYQHIGNLRTYIFEDLLKRMFLYNGYKVNHIVNITDVGHLTSDEDEGEDKMEVGASREGKTVWELAEYYTDIFIKDTIRLNILQPDKWTKATDHIPEQIGLIKCLEAKGFTYITSDGVYFDTSKINNYGELAQLDISGLKPGHRIELSEEKKNITDFSLWKFSPKDKKRQMEWESTWGTGFPGWHIECSAMAMKYLGNHFDVHCGGIDHIPGHHTNEIAQSEACTGEKFVNYWLHGAFLEEESGKMSKSKGEFLTVQALVDKGYDPLDYRYMCLGTNYGKRLLFSWENLDAAKSAYTRLKNRVIEFKKQTAEHIESTETPNHKETIEGYKQQFNEAVNDDLNISSGLAVLWDVVKNELLPAKSRLELLYDFDNVLGLGLKEVEEKKEDNIPEEIMKLVEERTAAKKAKDFKRADEIRAKIKEMGYEIVDKKDGVEVKKSS
ncbi:MAG: cysteine--tRNA ligase [Ignavibacteriae bacterium]|nr:MAG: cysteine--tRNA ligase [Ignavibacteriota bacterium]